MSEKSKWQIISNNLFNIIMIAFSIYLIYLIVGLMVKNYHIDQQIDDLQKQVTILEIQNYTPRDYLEYYKSMTYQELELRQRLLLKKPGENVVLLPLHKENDQISLLNTQKQLIETNQQKQSLPNYYKWWGLMLRGQIPSN